MSTAGTGTLRSFNYDGSVHLANQQQVACVRREQGKCKICWYASTATDVAVSQFGTTAQGITKDNFCCGYGTKGGDSIVGQVYDCLMIPGAIKGSSPDTVVQGAIQCGGGKGVITKSASSPVQTVCCKYHFFFTLITNAQGVRVPFFTFPVCRMYVGECS